MCAAIDFVFNPATDGVVAGVFWLNDINLF